MTKSAKILSHFLLKEGISARIFQPHFARFPPHRSLSPLNVKAKIRDYQQSQTNVEKKSSFGCNFKKIG
ncbi:MAG: hypothetical protein ACHQIM_09825 [Sphingobacteriales bacterium]